MKVSEETDYKKHEIVQPNYQYFRINQQTGSTSGTFSTSGGETSVFEIPTNVFNLSKSVLRVSVTATGQAGDYTGLVLHGALAFIRDIELYTQNGTRLCFVTNLPRYMKVASSTDTPLEEFYGNTSNNCFYKNNFINGSTNYKLSLATGTAVNLATARISTTLPYVEPQAFVTSGADNTDSTVNFDIPLSQLRNTIFDLNKDLYMGGEIVYLRITWNGLRNFGFSADDATLVNQNNATTTGALQSATYANLNLYLAVEKNAEIVNQIKNKVNTSGMNILIDYIHSYSQILTANGAHSLSYKFSRGHGRRLKRIYCSPYFNTQNTGTGYIDNNYGGGVAITDLYTMLNNERLQQWTMATATNTGRDEYMILKEKLKGSSLQSLDQYQYNYFWLDSWDNLKTIERAETVECGVPLDEEKKWDLISTVGGARAWHTFAVVQRVLSISKEGILVD